MIRIMLALTGLLALGAAPTTAVNLDSQMVLQRYALAVAAVTVPKVVIYSYTVSQVGPSNIEQRHQIYRSGNDVRDETLTVDGIALRRKMVRFSSHADRYAVDRFAPTQTAYELLFLGTTRDGRHLDYVYEATPLNHELTSWIDRLTIDGANFLPRAVHFHSNGVDVTGAGEIEFAPFGRYWLPVRANASATVKGKPAREHLAWSDYRFPSSLPPSTFQPPQPLPHASLPPI